MEAGIEVLYIIMLKLDWGIKVWEDGGRKDSVGDGDVRMEWWCSMIEHG